MPTVKEWRECPVCHASVPVVARVRCDGDVLEWVWCRRDRIRAVIPQRPTTALHGFTVSRAACRICPFRGTVTHGAKQGVEQVRCPRCQKFTLEDRAWDEP